MTCCVFRRVVSLLFVSLLLWFAPDVWANNVPVDGVFVPWGSIADHDDAVSFRLNTASTGFQEGWIFSLTHTGLRVPWEPTADQDPSLNGDGLALFWSQRFLGLLSTSVGLQYLYPDSANAAGEQLGAHLRASLGSAVLVHPTLSTSLTAHLLIGDEVGFSNLFQFDVGMLWRPLNVLSVGVNVRNVLAPRFGTVVTPRTWEVGLSIRPLSSARLSLSADVSLPETTGRIDFRYRLEGEPLHGWVLGASFAHSANYQNNFTPGMGVMVGAYLAFRFGRVGVSSTGMIGLGNQTTFQNMTVSAWVRGKPHRPLIRTGGKMVLLDLGGTLPERQLGLTLAAGQPTFLRVLQALYRIAYDPKVVGLLLRLGNLRCSVAKLEELREALEAIRKKKKKIVVYATGMNLRTYFVASVADKVFMSPVGNVQLGGLASRRIFWADTFAKVGVKAEFLKFGKYKTAPNTYTKTGFTPAHKEASNALLDDLFGVLQKGLSKSRGRKLSVIKSWFRHGIFSAAQAKKRGLVDDVFYWDMFEQKLRKHIKIPYTFDVKYVRRRYVKERWRGRDKIAVIYVDGAIVSGPNLDDPLFGTHLTGSRTIVKLLIKARFDPSVKGVVLRVDSPGGSVIAADTIWRYVEKLKRVKPVVVSMGGVAASGGYYVAAPAHEILAMPGTITGSIGIYTGKFDFSGLMKKIGAHVKIQKRGEMADIFSPFRAFSKQQRKQLLASILVNYDQFLDKVVKGRKMKLEKVKRLAAGRVWSGIRAKKHGLIDDFGGLWKAIERVRIRAQIPKQAKLDVVGWPRFPSWRLSLSGLPSISVQRGPSTAHILQTLQRYKQIFQRLQSVNVWAVEPNEVTVQ